MEKKSTAMDWPATRSALYGFVVFKDTGAMLAGAELYEEPVHDGTRLDHTLTWTPAAGRSGLSRKDVEKRASLVKCTGFNHGVYSFTNTDELATEERQTFLVNKDEFHILWLGAGTNAYGGIFTGEALDSCMRGSG